jgi:hypothetical protein
MYAPLGELMLRLQLVADEEEAVHISMSASC